MTSGGVNIEKLTEDLKNNVPIKVDGLDLSPKEWDEIIV